MESYETPEWIRSLAAERRATREQLADRASVRVPSVDPDYGYEGLAWPAWPGRDRGAILQPPMPEIRPASQVAERAAALTGRVGVGRWSAEREAELE